MADGGEDDVGRIALAPLEMTAAEMAIGLHVTDHRLDGRAAPELVFDHAEDATPLAGDEDPARVCHFVTAIALIDIGERAGSIAAAPGSRISVSSSHLHSDEPEIPLSSTR